MGNNKVEQAYDDMFLTALVLTLNKHSLTTNDVKIKGRVVNFKTELAPDKIFEFLDDLNKSTGGFN